MTKISFKEMVERAKREKFSLPHNVEMIKHLMPNGKWSYVFRHDELGELGRILIVPYGNQSQICSEVVGEPDDPMTKKRMEIFAPISKDGVYALNPEFSADHFTAFQSLLDMGLRETQFCKHKS